MPHGEKTEEGDDGLEGRGKVVGEKLIGFFSSRYSEISFSSFKFVISFNYRFFWTFFVDLPLLFPLPLSAENTKDSLH